MAARSSAVWKLQKELTDLQGEDAEGFTVRLVDDSNLFVWECAIFGPPATLYQGGYFKAHINFPLDYPFAPPSFKFLTQLWHPNVYPSGALCISILNNSGWQGSDEWNPTQTVGTIILSIISLLNAPNTDSAANPEASAMYTRWKESEGADNEYERTIREQVVLSQDEAKKDNVIVPITKEDYCKKNQTMCVPSEEHVCTDDYILRDDEYYEDSCSTDDS